MHDDDEDNDEIKQFAPQHNNDDDASTSSCNDENSEAEELSMLSDCTDFNDEIPIEHVETEDADNETADADPEPHILDNDNPVNKKIMHKKL